MKNKVNHKGRARAPLAARLACLLAAVLCVFGAAGATGAVSAYADQAGDSFDLGVATDDYNSWCGATALRPVCTNNGAGDQVFCVELGRDNQTGTGTVADLEGSTTLYEYNGTGAGLSFSSHTWSRDNVTEAALIYQWSVQKYNWDWNQGTEAYKKQWGLFQRMLWMYCNSNFSLDNMGNMARWPSEYVDAAEVARYVRANKANYTGHGLLYSPNGGTRQASARFWVTPNTGTAKLRKTSANAALTDNNPCYSLEGAVYDVYDNSACSGSPVATLTTGKDGNTNTVELTPGEYWVKERTASKGYALCGEVHKVTVEAGKESTVECSEKPQNDPFVMQVQKVDSATGEAVAQGDATLAGAVFEVKYFANMDADASGEPAATWFLKTDAEGKTSLEAAKKNPDTYFLAEHDGVKSSGFFLNTSGVATLPLGTVSVREVAAPAGYTVSDSSAKVQVISSTGFAETVANGVIAEGDAAVKEKVVTGKVTGVKVDSARDEAVAQGDATLAGAEVALWNRSTGSVVIGGETVAPGKAYSKTAVTDESGNWSFEGLPYGTYEVKETKASKGYRLNEKWSQTFKVEKDGRTVELTGEAALEQDVMTGSASGVKVDSARDEAVAQGDATLAGAEVTLWNRSAESVRINGEWVEKDGKYSVPAVTDEDGNWSFGDLPYGTYEVRETKPSKGYVLNDSWSWTFEVREDNKDVTDGRKARLEQEVARGGVGAVKVDAQRDEAVAEGAATLAGAVLQVRNASAKSVYVDNVEYGPGEVIDPEKSPSAKLVTDGEGRASTSDHALPYGTYELTEKTPSKGYKLNAGWKATLEVREEGEVVWAERHAENGHLEEQVVRGDFNFDKVEGFSQSEMAGVPFLVTSRATGESHVVVTDANGQVDTSADFTKHTQDTNASDAALNAEKTAIADESKLVTDGSAGVWFHGYADHEVAVDDSLGALPYDTYDVVELACSKNTGHNLVSFTVTVTRDGVNIDKGTKEDSEIGISTTLTCAGEKEAPMAESVTLTDEVQFENVKRGEHTMTAVVHLVSADGADEGEVARATKSFTNTVTTGHVDVDIELDTTRLGGKKLVCFEYLDLSEDGKTYLASHEDIADEGQTVSVPKPEISTTASGDVGQESLAQAATHLTDTVAYKGLTPGKKYELRATVHVRNADGTDAGALKDADGNEVAATASFTPQSAEGTAEVGYDVDSASLAGKTVVFFEGLYRDGVKVAAHEDIADEGQSVSFPKVATHASEKESGEQVAEAKQSVTITDAVSYENLTAGKTYKVSGTLHVKGADGSDAGELLDAEGNAYTAEKEFTAEKSAGTLELEFTVDASALAGKSVVAFEDLSRDGVKVGSHADINDGEQTVSFPKVGTELTCAGEKETQAKEGKDGKKTVELTDTVGYEGLLPGRTYTLTGTLHRRSADGEDKGAVEGTTSTVEIVPESASGTAEVRFSLDVSKLGDGEAVVAFEQLSLKGADGKAETTVARHEDIADEGQTVRIVEVGTTAGGKVSGTHEEQGDAETTVVDKVAYKGLTAGKTYKVSGTLHVKGDDGADAGELKDADGNAVTAEKEFVAEKADGEVEVEFTFDASALAGKTVVAFEELSRDGKTVATHADISDADQSVTIVSIGTTATDKADGDHEVECAESVTVVDKVAYKGLTAGKTYKVSGTLHVKGDDGADAGELKDADGNAVTAEKEFVAEKADGEVEVEFTFDASALAGKTVVAFEELSRDGKTVATHADISDADQSVTVKQPETPTTPETPSTPSSPLPKTGVGPLALALVACGAAAAAVAGGRLAWAKRREAGDLEDEEEPEE